jgi:hypothetical protein
MAKLVTEIQSNVWADVEKPGPFVIAVIAVLADG